MKSNTRKTTRAPWMTYEVAIVREYYPTSMPIAEIAKMIPNHPAHSISAYAQKVMNIRRPANGKFYENTGWSRIAEALKSDSLTVAEIAAKTGTTKQSTGECLRRHRGKWHIASDIPRHGKYTRRIALGAGEDVLTIRKGKAKANTAAEIIPASPFSVALGLVQPVQSIKGRVIKQDMTIHLDHLDEMEAV